MSTSGARPETSARPLRVLFVCTRNAARSQIAEALLRRKGRERFIAASAGAQPAAAIHPLTRRTLADHGLEWDGRPKGVDAVVHDAWDFVITLCDRAREVCPALPGQPIYAHWSVPDPTDVVGDEAQRYRAFEDAVTYISRRIDLMLALPHAEMERAALEHQLRAIDVASLDAPTPRDP